MEGNSLRGGLGRAWNALRAKPVLLVVAGIVLLALTFATGVAVGAAAFGRDPLLAIPFSGRVLPGSRNFPRHGAIGVITEISPNTLKMTDDRSGETSIISISAQTMVERGPGNRIQFTDLKVGDHIVVIGEPTDGVILARFIGIKPEGDSPQPFKWNGGSDEKGHFHTANDGS